MNHISSNIDYGKALVSASIDGARDGRKLVLDGASVDCMLARSSRNSLPSVAIGAGLGVLCGLLATRRNRDFGKVLGWGLAGAVTGFSAAMAWETRRLTGGMARGAIKNLERVRDDHWLATHPIDYG